MKRERAAWTFVSPALLVIGIFFALPVVAAFALSLTDFDLYSLANLKNLRFVGFDTSAKIVEALRQGHMDATVVQDPIRMGYLAVKTVGDQLRGARIEKRIDTGATLIRRDEMDQPRMKELLFPDYQRWLKE